MSTDKKKKGHLPRLDRKAYGGPAYVHWTLTMKRRQEGWLTPAFHAAFREMLGHAQARYPFLCPTYCLMPDHIHMLWLGAAEQTDQMVAIDFFRKQLKPLLAPVEWQDQPYDHVLREKDRERNAFQAAAWYILENPVRAGLVKERGTYPHSGCFVLGYPDLSPFQDGYWELYWRIDGRLRKKQGAPE